MSTLPTPNVSTNSVAAYITRDLGYCCTWCFFQLYAGPEWTQTVADRLGVSARAVRYCRAKAIACPDTKGCKRSAIYRIVVKRAAAEPDSPQTRKETF